MDSARGTACSLHAGELVQAQSGRRMGIRTKISGRDIVCVGFADWDTDLWTNQHHLMARLALTNRVLFVESLPQPHRSTWASRWRNT